MHSAGGDHPMSSSEIRVHMPASRQHVHDGDRFQSTAKLLIWINLDEWGNHNRETEWRGLHKINKNINCGSRKTCKYKTTLSTNWSGGGHWHILLNTDERIPEFRGHCGRAFTQYEQIRHIRGKLKLMTEATCRKWRIGWIIATGGELSLSMSSRIFKLLLKNTFQRYRAYAYFKHPYEDYKWQYPHKVCSVEKVIVHFIHEFTVILYKQFPLE